MDRSVVLVLAAGGGPSPFVADLGLCLVAAGLLAVAFEKLRIPSIAALLGAGVLIGPAGLEAIADRENIDTIATLGLTLLLFVIGLEVKVGGLLASGRTLVVTGLLQVPLTMAAGFGVFLAVGAAGWTLTDGTYPALYLGIACAFSSTLLVAKFLQEHLLVDSVAGRLCIGLLIFQDVWAIVFMAVQPSLSDPAIAPILLTFVGTAIVGAVATLVARFVLSHAFHAVARSPELVVTLALGWCFGVGLFGAHLGSLAGLLGLHVSITVSMEMGALIAGATIATSPYAYEVVARVTHLRDFFVTLFFVGLGMSIPVPDGASVLLLALVVAVVAILLRGVVFLPLLYATGLDRRNSLDVSVKLAQVSEFCLVIAYVGARLGHIDETQVSVIIFAFVLSALSTPFLFAASDKLYARLRRFLDALGIRARDSVAERDDAEQPPRLVLLGFHRVASALLTELERLHPDVVPSILVIDTNAANHARLRERGVRVVYGNIATGEVLRHAGIAGAEVVVSTVPDELLAGTSNADVVRTVRQIAPGAAVMAGCSNSAQLAQLRAAGAAFVFHLPTEVALGVLPAVYAALNNQLPSYVETADEQHGSLETRSHVID